MARLLALLIGCALAGLVAWAGVAFGALKLPQGDQPAFGFVARYELPRLRPDDRCGTMNGGPTSSPCIEGPHARFDEIGPRQLALDSIAWFTQSSAADAWKDNPTARLELEYASDGLDITVRHAREAQNSWEDQLGVWFDRFPPRGDGYAHYDGDYSWTIDFDDRGRVRGAAASDTAAVEQMKAIVTNLEASSAFGTPKFVLLLGVRRSSHEMDCFSADAESVEQLDDLPRLVKEQRAHRESLMLRLNQSSSQPR